MKRRKNQKHNYRVVDLRLLARQIEQGEVSVEQKIALFKRVVDEANHQVDTLGDEIVVLKAEIDVLLGKNEDLERENARLKTEAKKHKAERKRASKRRGTQDHCGPKRHRDKYKLALVEPEPIEVEEIEVSPLMDPEASWDDILSSQNNTWDELDPQDSSSWDDIDTQEPDPWAELAE